MRRPVARVARLARVTAPWGTDVEVVLDPTDAPTSFSSELVPGGFLTDGVGFGHVVLATTAFDESVAFVTAGLGFEQSDWLETEIAPGINLEVRFFHCNARHHSVALARAPFELPQTLHHVMFEMNERDDVGAAFDRLWAGDLGIPNGLGRHDNDGMFSFYLQTPAGFQIEVGHGARRHHRRVGRQPGVRRDQRVGPPTAAPGVTVDVDVTIVGAGPVGLVLGIQLAQRGRSVAILEQRPRAYSLPRAVHFDHEVGRILQSCGIGDQVRAVSEPAEVYEWRNAEGTTLLRFGRIGAARSGWPFSSMFCQPDVEAQLDRRGSVAALARPAPRGARRRARAARWLRGRRPRVRRPSDFVRRRVRRGELDRA